MEIDQLNHVALHVHDLERSVRFYRDVLRLPEIHRPAFNFPGAWFRIGSGSGADRQELHLIGREQPKEGGAYSVPRERHFAMKVVDMQAAAAHLREQGVEFTGPNPRPDGAQQIFLRDPDGHVVELCALAG
ncbi:MAG: VOC family protein [Phycisphaeraceae bacterium]